MTPAKRAVALRLAKWHQAMADEQNRNGAKKEKHAITADLLRELAAEPQGEPVAWCSLTPSGKIAYFDGKPMVMPGAVGNEVHRTPLYAHPPQQRKPLTERQIVSALADAGCCGTVKLTYDSGPYEVTCATAAAIDLVRAIERAHGIGEAP